MSELDLAYQQGCSSGDGEDDGASPHAAARGGWEGGHALKQQQLGELGGMAVLERGGRGGAVLAASFSLPTLPPTYLASPVCRPAGAASAAAAAAGGSEGEGHPPPRVDETADKLDSLMELTLEHLSRRQAAGQLLPAWDTLLAAFERSVLLTHRSKFTQFLLFFACRQSPDHCCRAFLQLLLARLTDRQQPPIARAAAAAYAASFLARWGWRLQAASVLPLLLYCC